MNHTGSSGEQPYTTVEDLTRTLRTLESDLDAAANRFMVPMTLISCMAALDICVGSITRNVWTMVSTWVAFTIRARVGSLASTRTYSVRSSSTVGSVVSSPTMTSTPGSASSTWAASPPQKVPSPVTRTRRGPLGRRCEVPEELMCTSPEPTRLSIAQHLVERCLDVVTDGLRLLHHT